MTVTACKLCGEQFERPSGSTMQFCSVEHRTEWKRRLSRAKNAPARQTADWESDPQVRRDRKAQGLCVVCGKVRPPGRAWTCSPEHERKRRGGTKGFADWAKERLTYSRGRWHGKAFEPPPWIQPALDLLFDTLDEHGRRVYRSIRVFVPKKNGKTEVAAALGLWGLMEAEERAPEVYVAGSTKEAARKAIWKAASLMAGPMISELKLQDMTMTIKHPLSGGEFSVLSADAAAGRQGMSPTMVIGDEMHEWMSERHEDTWESLTGEDATVARLDPIDIAITTAGRKRSGLGWKMWQEAKELPVLDPERPELRADPVKRMIAVVFAVPDDADWTDFDAVRAANPMTAVVTDDFIRARIAKAQTSREEELLHRRWRCNQWVEAADSPWLDLQAWDLCAGPPGELPMDRPCTAGLDFASSVDLTALAVAWNDDDGRVALRLFAWLAQGGIADPNRPRWERELLEDWRDAGWLTVLPGAVTPYRRLVDDMLTLLDPLDVWVALDMAGSGAVALQDFEDAGIESRGVRQSPFEMNLGCKELERLTLAGELRHGGNPILRHAASVTQLKESPNGYVMPERVRRRSRIDALVAAVMAIGELAKRPPEQEVEREAWSHVAAPRRQVEPVQRMVW